MTTLVIIAKEPLPGKAKTRLHPPLSLEQAAGLAAAAIDDTLESMQYVPATRRILLFDGERVPALADGYEVVPQSEGGLDERLGAIFDQCTGPMVLIGMDTPQVSIQHLLPAFVGWSNCVDAWFGPASDGGWWALGLREPNGDLIRGVPMSQDNTGDLTLQRLRDAGLMVELLPTLTDVDTIQDADEVASAFPKLRFSSRLASYSAAAMAGAEQ